MTSILERTPGLSSPLPRSYWSAIPALLVTTVLVMCRLSYAQPAPQTDSPAQSPRSALRHMLCGDSTPQQSDIPSIGCFQVASGHSATGTLDGRQFTVTIDAKGEPSCSLDGAAVACGACTDGSSDGCPVKILIVEHNADGSVLFNVQRRRNDGRYIYSREIWDNYVALQQRAATTQGPAAAQQLPPGLPPGLPHALMPAVIVQADGPGALASIAWETQRDYGAGQFAELEALIDKLSPPDQLTDDGKPRLLGVANGLWDFLYNWKDWQFDLKKIAQWRKEQPDSYAADIAEVILWRAWAWHDRGEGYSNTVAPEGWKLFTDRLEHAQTVLDQSKPRASRSPLWYQLSLSIGRDMQWDSKRYDALFREAIQRFPGYVPFYLSMSDYLSPKWGGSYEAVDKLARETTAKSGDYSMYARIYWNLSEQEEDNFDLFNDSPASWPLMKTGFDQLIKRYPKSLWNLNAYAAFACRAHDRETYSNLRARIGQNVIAAAWPSNQSTDVCDERLLGHA